MLRRHPHQDEAPAREDPRFTDPSIPSRSCCCPARPAMKVVMPPTAGRAHPVDLWLCGHHFRASLPALLAAGARVEDYTLTTDASGLSATPARCGAPRQTVPGQREQSDDAASDGGTLGG